MKCRHERQEWRDSTLPCAALECPESVPGAALVMFDPSDGDRATFDRALYVTGIAEVAGHALRRRCEARSWVWVRRGSPFNPRRPE